ncbi:hypothetical protein ACRAWD_12800 [Caulobacter segnis]
MAGAAAARRRLLHLRLCRGDLGPERRRPRKFGHAFVRPQGR